MSIKMLLTKVFFILSVLNIGAQETFQPPDSVQQTIYPSQIEKYSMGLSMGISGTYQLNSTSGPLLVIDGVPYPERTRDDLDYTTADLYDISRLAYVPLENIERVEFLANDVRYSYLGSITRNGILSITTKKSHSRKIQVDYSYRTTFKYQQKGYEMLSGDDYTMMMKQALYNPQKDEGSAYYPWLNYDPSYKDYYNYNKNTDWQDEITQTGITGEHYLTVHGSLADLDYGVTSLYRKEQGTIIHSENEDYTLGAYLDYSAFSFIKARLNIQYHNVTSNGYYQSRSGMSLMELAVKAMPNMSVYKYGDGTQTSDYFVPEYYSLTGSLWRNSINPVERANNSREKRLNKILNPNFHLEITPFKSLKYLLDASYQQMAIETDRAISYDPSEGIQDANETLTVNTDRAFIANRLLYKPYLGIKSELIIEGSHLIEEWHSEMADQRLSGSSSSFYSIETSGIKKVLTFSSKYAYDSKYIIHASINSDNTNKPNFWNRYDLGAQWIASNESFFENLKFLDYLAVGGSYNVYEFDDNHIYDSEDSNVFDYNASYLFGYSRYVVMPASPLFNIQKNKELNVSINIMKRLALNFNAFTRQNFEDSFDYSLSGQTTGIQAIATPFTYETKHSGWEINTQLLVVDQPTVKLTVFANLYHVNSKFMDVDNHNPSLSNGKYSIYTKADGSYGDIYGYKYKGVYQFDEYIAGSQKSAPVARDAAGNVILNIDGNPVPITYGDSYSSYAFQGGDAIYQDVNGDGRINEQDLLNLGNVNPKLSGTMGTSMQYKNWELGVFFNFRYGNDMVNIAHMSLSNMYTTSNQTTETNNRWRKQGDQSDIPRALYNDGHNWLGSSRYVEDASLIRLNSLTLRHNFSKHITSKLHLNNLSMYVTAKNLFTLSNYPGADPDIMWNTQSYGYGYDDNYQGVIEEWTFGINIGI